MTLASGDRCVTASTERLLAGKGDDRSDAAARPRHGLPPRWFRGRDAAEWPPGGQDESAHVWEAATGRLIRALDGHTSAVVAVVMALDGGTIVTGRADSTVKVWAAATGRLVRTSKDTPTGFTRSRCRRMKKPLLDLLYSGRSKQTVRAYRQPPAGITRALDLTKGDVRAVRTPRQGRDGAQVR